MKLKVGESYRAFAGSSFQNEFIFIVKKIEAGYVWIVWNADWEERKDIEFRTLLKSIQNDYGKVIKLTKLEKAMK